MSEYEYKDRLDPIVAEDSVGSMLPITEPDEVMRKPEIPTEAPISDAYSEYEGMKDPIPEPSIAEAYAALQIPGVTEELKDGDELPVPEDSLYTEAVDPFSIAIFGAYIVITGAIVATGIHDSIVFNKDKKALERVFSKDKKFVPYDNLEKVPFRLNMSRGAKLSDAGVNSYSVDSIRKAEEYERLEYKIFKKKVRVNTVTELYAGDKLVGAFFLYQNYDETVLGVAVTEEYVPYVGYYGACVARACNMVTAAYNAMVNLYNDVFGGSSKYEDVDELPVPEDSLYTEAVDPFSIAIFGTFAVLTGVAVTEVFKGIRYLKKYEIAKENLEKIYSRDKKFVRYRDLTKVPYQLNKNRANGLKDRQPTIDDITKAEFEKLEYKIFKKTIRANTVTELLDGDKLVAAFFLFEEQGFDLAICTVGLAVAKGYEKYCDYYTACAGADCQMSSAVDAMIDLYKEVSGDHSYGEDGDDIVDDVFVDRLAESGIESVMMITEECNDLVDVWEGWGDEETTFTEAAKIDDDIKDIIKTLNDKGYKTLYSCSGHPSARLKSDGLRDGIKNGKIYSTARIVFDKDYGFSSYPKNWEPKELDDGKFGIYVSGPTYNLVNGIPVEQFYKWKKRYMYHLEKWVNDLPEAGSSEKKEDEDTFTEAAETLADIVNDIILDSMP